MTIRAVGGQIRVSIPDNPSLVIGYGNRQVYWLGEGLSLGAATKARQYAKSAFVDFQELVGIKREASELIVPVIILAQDFEDFEVKLEPLVVAFEQFTYNVRYVPEGEFDNVHGHFLWRCESADWALGEGGTLKNIHWQHYAQVVTFNVPRNEALSGVVA